MASPTGAPNARAAGRGGNWQRTPEELAHAFTNAVYDPEEIRAMLEAEDEALVEQMRAEGYDVSSLGQSGTSENRSANPHG